MNMRFCRSALMALGLTALLTVGAGAAYEGVGTVTGDTLNFRAQPTTDSAKLATVPKGSVVLVVDRTGDWYEVDCYMIRGYMHADWLSFSDDYNATICYGRVETEGATLNLRSAPSGSRLASIPHGTIIPLYGMQDGWFKTAYNGVTGYVSGEYVLAVNADGTRSDDKGSAPSVGTPAPSGSTVESPAEEVPSEDPSAPADDLGQQIVDYAMQFIGKPYVYGAEGPNSFDCSGFTGYVYEHFGYSLGRSAAAQLSDGVAVDMSEIQIGDIICWRAYGSSKAATHVGIYIGNNEYIHASTTGYQVRINEMSYGSNVRYVVGVRRII